MDAGSGHSQGREAVTREHKLALIIGFAVVLVVGVLLSDHLSGGARERAGGVEGSNSQSAVGSATGPAFELSDPGPPGPPRAANPGVGHQVGPKAARETPVAVQEPLFTLNQGAADASNSRNGSDRAGAIASGAAALVAEARRRGMGVRGDPSGTLVIEPLAATNRRQGNGSNAGRPGQPGRARDRVHHVRAGQTLSSIADRYYGQSGLWRLLYAYNRDRIVDANRLPVGLALRIPSREVLEGAARSPPRNADPKATKPKATKRQPAPRAYATYTVRSGDTLGEIAQRLLGTVRRLPELIDLNRDRLDDENRIQVGMTLRVPPK